MKDRTVPFCGPGLVEGKMSPPEAQPHWTDKLTPEQIERLFNIADEYVDLAAGSDPSDNDYSNQDFLESVWGLRQAAEEKKESDNV